MPEEFRLLHPHVPWRETVGMRNRLIHGYDAMDFDILWAVIREDLPPLIETIEAILNKQK